MKLRPSERLSELVRLVGWPITLKIVHTYGGVKMFIPPPDKITPDHTLSRLIGEMPAKRLAEHFMFHQFIEVPSGGHYFRRVRLAKAVKEDHEKGDSLRVIARRYEISERHVTNLIRAAKEISEEFQE